MRGQHQANWFEVAMDICCLVDQEHGRIKYLMVTHAVTLEFLMAIWMESISRSLLQVREFWGDKKKIWLTVHHDEEL